jgi:hypothetical protein
MSEIEAIKDLVGVKKLYFHFIFEFTISIYSMKKMKINMSLVRLLTPPLFTDKVNNHRKRKN